MLVLRFYCLLVLFQSFQLQQLHAQKASDTTANQWVIEGKDSLFFKPYFSKVLKDHPTLVVIIHGDAPFNKPSYQYRTASLVASQNENVMAIGILRPGYTDPENHHSSGERGLTSADNYTPLVVDRIAYAISRVADLHNAGKIIIVGHSGGAAITANILSRHPTLAQGAVLVACPCNVPEFRVHMKELTKAPNVWDIPVKSLSPHEGAGSVSKKTKVVVISGDQDEVALPRYSQEYYTLLQKQKVPVELINIAGEGHEILLNEKVLEAIGRMTNYQQ
jgi:predicted esterase